jgi:formylglycine-generating enzyme required for sulfatase activity
MLALPVLALGVLAGLGVFGRRPAPPTAKREVVNSIDVRLVRIPAGEFLMGAEEPAEQLLGAFPAHHRTPDDIKEEYPRHRVRITRPFFLGKFEVTVGEYRRFVEDAGYRTEPETDGQGGWGFNP